jgi:hypothetical protein
VIIVSFIVMDVYSRTDTEFIYPPANYNSHPSFRKSAIALKPFHDSVQNTVYAFPGVVWRNNNVLVIESALMFFRYVKIRNGVIVSIHPHLFTYLVRCWTKDRKVRVAGNDVVSMFRRTKRYFKSTFPGCCRCIFHKTTFDVPTFIESVYFKRMCGGEVCDECIRQVFYRDENWVTRYQASKHCSIGIYEKYIQPMFGVRLGYIYAGMVVNQLIDHEKRTGVLGYPQTREMTVAQYEQLGAEWTCDPGFHMGWNWRDTVKRAAGVLGPKAELYFSRVFNTSIREIFSEIDQRHFLYFGWIVTIGHKKVPYKVPVSISSKFDEELVNPFVYHTIRSNSDVRRIGMHRSFAEFIKMLHFMAPIHIVPCAPGYVFARGIDGRLPIDVVSDAKLCVYNAEYLDWTGVLKLVKTNKEVTLYGSFRNAFAGKFDRGGVFCSLLMMASWMNNNKIGSKIFSFSGCGPELVPLSFDEEEQYLYDQERKFIEGDTLDFLGCPVQERHVCWTNRHVPLMTVIRDTDSIVPACLGTVFRTRTLCNEHKKRKFGTGGNSTSSGAGAKLSV